EGKRRLTAGTTICRGAPTLAPHIMGVKRKLLHSCGYPESRWEMRDSGVLHERCGELCGQVRGPTDRQHFRWPTGIEVASGTGRATPAPGSRASSGLRQAATQAPDGSSPPVRGARSATSASSRDCASRLNAASRGLSGSSLSMFCWLSSASLRRRARSSLARSSAFLIRYSSGRLPAMCSSRSRWLCERRVQEVCRTGGDGRDDRV